MHKKKISSKVLVSLLTLSCVYSGGTFAPRTAEAATELTDQAYTNFFQNIRGGDYTVSVDDVALNATNVGIGLGQKPVFDTNYNINVDIADGKTLTIRGNNIDGSTERATLYAHQISGLYGEMTFTGGNIVVSNEFSSGNTSKITGFGVMADDNGKFVFKSDGANKVNLAIVIPNVETIQHRVGIGLHQGKFEFDGGNFIIEVPDSPGADSVDRRVGIMMASGSELNVKADSIYISADERALQFSAMVGEHLTGIYGVTNKAVFDADTIVLRGNAGIAAISTDYRNRNEIEFKGNGKTEIYAICRGNSSTDTAVIWEKSSGGQAVNIERTDLVFDNEAVVKGENLTAKGTEPGYLQDPGGQFEHWIDPYWLKTVSLGNESHLVANKDFTLESNGGYYNTGLHVWGQSLAQFNGQTKIVVKNGVDTARAVYVYDGRDGTTRAEFKDDLMISTAGSNAAYLYGINAEAGGKVDVQKGLVMNDNSKVYSLYANGAGSQINVNLIGGGEVQVVGSYVWGARGGIVNMVLNRDTSYLTAGSWVSDDGKVNLDISEQAVWNMTKTSKTTDLALSSGAIVDMRADGNAYSKLTTEKLIGAGGIFKQDIDVRTMESDKIFVTGDFSGTQALDIYQKDDYIPAASSMEGTGLVLASVNGSGVFTAKDREGTLFNTHYLLKDKASAEAGFTTDWYLDKVVRQDPFEEPTTSVETVLSANALNYHTWRTENDKLLRRMGELRNNGEAAQGAWFRMQGSKIGRSGSFGFENKYTAYELGYDEVTKRTEDVTRYQGFALSYTDGNSSYSSGSGDNSSKAISFYNTEIGSKGHYLDVVLKISNMDNDFAVYDTNSSKITGDFNNTGVALSAEYGRKNALNNGWYIEPQTQFTLGYLGGDNYTASNGIEVSQSGIRSAVGRIGFNIGKEIGSKGIVYAKANLLHEFGGGYDVSMRDSSGRVAVSDSFNDTWFEYGIGAALQTGKNNHIYFDVERSSGSDFKKDWQWNAGARWTF